MYTQERSRGLRFHPANYVELGKVKQIVFLDFVLNCACARWVSGVRCFGQSPKKHISFKPSLTFNLQISCGIGINFSYIFVRFRFRYMCVVFLRCFKRKGPLYRYETFNLQHKWKAGQQCDAFISFGVPLFPFIGKQIKTVVGSRSPISKS